MTWLLWLILHNFSITVSNTLMSFQISVSCKVFGAEGRQSVIEESDHIPQILSLQEEIIL